MKIALYIEDGLEQIVLTPETDIEKGIVGKLHDDSRDLQIYQGGFYECQGGWVRHERAYPEMSGVPVGGKDNSTIIVLRPKETKSVDEGNI